MEAPILRMPTSDGLFLVDSDASNTGVGAVLSKLQNGTEVVLARTLTIPEQHYDVTRKELLAIVFAFKTFKQYLLGRHFSVCTNHSTLQWLRQTLEPMGRWHDG